MLRPHVKTIIIEILKVLRETENDDLTSVLQKLVCSYIEEIIPLAIDITTHLVSQSVLVLGLTSNFHGWLFVHFSDWWSTPNRLFYSIAYYLRNTFRDKV